MLCRMATAVSAQTPSRHQTSWIKRLLVKIVSLVILGLVFGFGYDWAAPRLYGPERATGFRLGVVHGALMPVALPTLLMGNDVPIYTTSPAGRTYTLGYIAGINLCGLLFFGVAFWQPKRRECQTADSPLARVQ